MDISENEIEWTKGTDKPYGQIVYEHWKDKLGQNPTKKEIRGLRNEVLATKNSVKKIKKHYEDILSSPNCGNAGAINALEHLELYEDSHKRLSNLYDSYKEPEDKTVNNAGTYNPESTSNNDIDKLAIDRVVDDVRDKTQCRKVLNRYLHLCSKYPNKTDNKLFDGDAEFDGIIFLMNEKQRSKYYKWLKKLKTEIRDLKSLSKS